MFNTSDATHVECSYHNSKVTIHKLLHTKVFITAAQDKVTNKQKESSHTKKITTKLLGKVQKLGEQAVEKHPYLATEMAN